MDRVYADEETEPLPLPGLHLPGAMKDRKKEGRAVTLGGRSVRITEEVSFAWRSWVKFLR